MFQSAVDTQRGDRRSRGTRYKDQFVAMLYCKSGYAMGLLAVEEGFLAAEAKLLHLRMQEASVHSLLAHTNVHRLRGAARRSQGGAAQA